MKNFFALGILVASSAFAADGTYLCKDVSPSNTPGGSDDVISYKIEFTHGLFSGQQVSFIEHNSASNEDSPILKSISVKSPIQKTAGPNWFEDVGGVNYSDQSFLLVQSGDAPIVFGESDQLYLSDALLNRQSSGLALYSHSMANLISNSASHYTLNCSLEN